MIQTEIDGIGYKCGDKGDKCRCDGKVQYKNARMKTISVDVDTEFLCPKDEIENPSSKSVKRLSNNFQIQVFWTVRL